MTRFSAFGVIFGLALVIILLLGNDVGKIFEAILDTGWGLAFVVVLHLPQTFFAALGWRSLVPSPRPSFLHFYGLRWIRESANSLLPTAQVGGDLIRARLLAQRGIALNASIATSMVDLGMEFMGQIIFTLAVVLLLVVNDPSGDIVPVAVTVAGAGGVAGVAFLISQRFGLFKLVEAIVERMLGGKEGTLGQRFSGLNDAVVGLYRHPARLWASTGHHFVSWSLGVFETWAGLSILGVDAGLHDAVLIEGLIQAVRSMGFLVPGALGVQEGGYLVVCAMLGVPPHQALALSLVRRARELLLGLPGLWLWHRLEKKHRSKR